MSDLSKCDEPDLRLRMPICLGASGRTGSGLPCGATLTRGQPLRSLARPKISY